MKRSFVGIAAVVILLGATLLAPTSAASDSEPTWKRIEPLLHFHNEEAGLQGLSEGPCSKTIDAKRPVRSCAGLVDSFDGLSLSVGVRMPADATEPLPTLLYLHGAVVGPIGGRGEFATTVSGWGSDRPGEEPESAKVIADALAASGYAVVMPSARGTLGSCGLNGATGPHFEEVPPIPQPETPHGPDYPGAPGKPDHTCSRGWSHLGDRDYEIRDYQTLLGHLVDLGVADPDRLGVLGWSYGGGQAWLLATSEPWLTPSGDRKIQLAAAVPGVSGTSFQDAVAPNGRANDDPEQDRSLEKPFGIVKQSAAVAFFGVSLAARANQTDPSEQESFVPGWFAFWESGEPYDDTPEREARSLMLRNKSAYFADAYFSGVGSGAIEPVPVLAIQGWNDATFPAVGALQMYRKLKSADPNYPISLFLGDIGHPTGRGHGTREVKETWRRLVREFLDSVLLHGVTPGEQIVSMSTECPPSPLMDMEDFLVPFPGSETVAAVDWDSIHPGLLTLKGEQSSLAGAPLETQSGPPNLVEEASTDPGSVHVFGGCITQDRGIYDEGVDHRWSVPDGGATLLGLPKLMADYVLTGEDATVIAKLWDVDDQGERTLVTRGVYRLSLAGGDEPEGTLKFQLFGNHYRFIEGHFIELEISQTDYPYLRVDDLPSTIEYSDVKLELPTTEIIED